MKPKSDHFLFAGTMSAWLGQFMTGSVLLALAFYGVLLFWLWRDRASFWGVFWCAALVFGSIAFVALDSQSSYFDSRLLGLFGGGVAALYFGFHAALLFWFLRAFLGLFGGDALAARIAIIAFCAALWAWWLTRVSLWPLGVVEGVFILHPLSPLISLRVVRALLGFLGDLVAVFVFSIVVMGVFELLQKRRWFVFLVFSCLWLFFELIPLQTRRPCWVDAVGVVVPLFCPFSDKGSFDWVEELETLLVRACRQDEEKCFWILPETAFPRVANEAFLETRLAQLSSDNRMVLIGVYRKLENAQSSIANATGLFWRGECVGYYDKSHRVVFAERFPAFFEKLLQIFDLQVRAFGVGDGQVVKFHTPLGVDCFPVMCSELFFTQRLEKFAELGDSFVCALINDGWFAGTPIARMMMQTACLHAAWARKELIYVAYEYQGFISSSGQWAWL